ncbi:MAG: cell division protein CrgA [Acidimicrobiia bacterium]|nr:cell division protein CrgA [Acidimicrobiia bacterium]MCL4292410.1 cell division protein CrgA [Acidimicrobiia bacterium]
MPVSKSKRSRYTPPAPKNLPPSPLWVPASMFTLLLTGTVVIVLNYLGILPGDAQNSYLVLGIAQITAGFVLATRFR